MDLFSFILGVGVTVGILYLIRCVQTNKKIRKHILGGPPTQWGPYPLQPIAPSFQHNAPTAPYQHSTTKTSQIAIPWQIA